MALTDVDTLYGFAIPSSTYDDSASPQSDNEDAFNASEGSQIGGAGNLLNGEALSQEAGEQEGKRKSRRPPSTAERRATHNAVERARRESLNGRFMELASALPSMASVKRPSKSVIVAKSLEYVYATEDRERVLRAENASLRKEVDELRAKLGMGPSVSTSPAIVAPSPRVDRERNGSIDDSGSSLLGCSPISSGGSFESPLPNVQPLGSANPAYTAAFARAMLPNNVDLTSAPPTCSADTSASLNASTNNAPLPVNALPIHMGLPVGVHPLAAYDSNYLLAFSMQQQQQQQAAMQQQNALSMAMSNSPLAGWSNYGFGMQNMNHPMSTADYPANLVFA